MVPLAEFYRAVYLFFVAGAGVAGGAEIPETDHKRNIQQEVAVNIHVKCGVCGNDVAAHASVTESGFVEIIATCPSCKAMDQEIGDLEDQIHELQKQKEVS
jgi:hypothetical protein